MTEKEVFLNMIHRVAEKAAGEEGEEVSDYYYENDNNSVTILNVNLQETFFYFDENGTLIFYE